MKRSLIVSLCCAGFVALYACSQSAPKQNTVEPNPAITAPTPTESPNSMQKKEPEYIKVQHILIAFKDAIGFKAHGGPPPKAANRSQQEAEALATQLLERVKKGEDFGSLVKEYTDDSDPGIYGMSNTGAPGKQGYYPRNGMVAAFGDTGFPLALGEIGMSVYDTKKSPYGWHIVKRIE